MKKNRIGLGLGLGLLIAGSSVALSAHEGEEGGAKGEEAGHEGGGWDKGRREEGMKKHLGLSDDQAAKMKEAGKAHQEAVKPLMEALKIDRDSLQLLVDKKASDAELTAALDKMEADHKALEAENQKHREAVKAILNPLQQAKQALSMGGPMGGPRGHWGKDKKDGPKEGGKKL